MGSGLAVTAHRAKGYDMGLVATLEKVEDVTSYGLHPAHQECEGNPLLSFKQFI